ncbi:MAG: LON peptidase substrate-binding domain-containing protein [Opitutaceae bacterium]|jgi:ATP-dependent Lon protease
MEMEIIVPDEIPVMTLPGVAFFPQALMPLHIFEPRYREMLRDVLATNRLFAIAGIDPRKSDEFEPPHRIATMGIVRACQGNADGTSNLLLQGLARVEIKKILRDDPYRLILMRALSSEAGADETENIKLRARLSRLLSTRQRLIGEASNELSRFLKSVDDPEVFVDLAAFSFCEKPRLKQKLLATLDVHRRLELFTEDIRADIETIKLRQHLQGGLPDEGIANN